MSCTLDLESTLIRAEALFRRFQRTVEAIDKKSNFPAPKLRQRKLGPAIAAAAARSISPTNPTSSNAETRASASTSGTDTGASNAVTVTVNGEAQNTAKGKDPASKKNGRKSEELEEQAPKIVSPELRELLSRKVEILPRKIVRKEGEGLAKVKDGK